MKSSHQIDVSVQNAMCLAINICCPLWISRGYNHNISIHNVSDTTDDLTLRHTAARRSKLNNTSYRTVQKKKEEDLSETSIRRDIRSKSRY